MIAHSVPTVRPLFVNFSVFPSRSIFLVSLLGNYSSYLSIRSISVALLALTANDKAISRLPNVSVAANRRESLQRFSLSSPFGRRQACTIRITIRMIVYSFIQFHFVKGSARAFFLTLFSRIGRKRPPSCRNDEKRDVFVYVQFYFSAFTSMQYH